MTLLPLTREISMDEFTCTVCKETFIKQNDAGWNEKKAREAYLDLHDETCFVQEETVIMCEPCGTKYYDWFSSLSEEEKKKIESEDCH